MSRPPAMPPARQPRDPRGRGPRDTPYNVGGPARPERPERPGSDQGRRPGEPGDRTFDERETSGPPPRQRGRRILADPEGLSPRLRRRRAWALVGLTYVVPGSAQIVAGNKPLGRFGLRVWFGALVVAGSAVLMGVVKRNWLLGFASRAWVLWALAALCVLLAVVWLVAFVDSARLARLKSLPARTRRGVLLLTVLGMAVTAGPLGYAASSLYAGGSVLRSVFGAGVSQPPANGRYNILLLGGDSGADRIGTRPDTIMLASMDASTGSTVTFGFARDTENINFRPGSTMARLMPQGWNCGDECLLNGLYMWATEHKDQFPPDTADPGALATKEAVEALSGLDIQYYALVDLAGFQRLVDAVGGIDLVSNVRVPVGGGSAPIHYYLEPGRLHLDGEHALWYARSREGSTNYERMARQKCVLHAASKQVDPQTVILKFRELAAAGQDTIRTDIPQGDLGGLADLVVKSRSKPIRSVNFTPPLINPWDYDPAVIRDTVARTLAAPEPTPTTRPGGDPAGPTGGGSGSANRDTVPTSPAGPAPAPATSGAEQDRAGGGSRDSSKGEQSGATPGSGPSGDAAICSVP